MVCGHALEHVLHEACVLVACAIVAQLQTASAGPYSPSPLSGDYHRWLIKPRAQAPPLIFSQIPTSRAEQLSSKPVWLSQVELAAQSKRCLTALACNYLDLISA